MHWFARHLNWTAVLVYLLGHVAGLMVLSLIDLLLEGVVQSETRFPPELLSVAAIGLWAGYVAVLCWLLRKKRRSWGWMLLVFVPYVGNTIFTVAYLLLRNNSQDAEQ